MGKDKMFVGLDPSYSSTGLIVLDQNEKLIKQENFSIVKGKKIESVEECLVEYERKIEFIPKIHNLYGVYIEGPSFQSNGQAVLQMGALHYFTRLLLFKNKVNFQVIAPNSLKKFICKGNAKKELVLLKVYKRWGEEFEINDLADAYGLARMAYEDFKNESN